MADKLVELAPSPSIAPKKRMRLEKRRLKTGMPACHVAKPDASGWPATYTQFRLFGPKKDLQRKLAKADPSPLRARGAASSSFDFEDGVQSSSGASGVSSGQVLTSSSDGSDEQQSQHANAQRTSAIARYKSDGDCSSAHVKQHSILNQHAAAMQDDNAPRHMVDMAPQRDDTCVRDSQGRSCNLAAPHCDEAWERAPAPAKRRRVHETHEAALAHRNEEWQRPQSSLRLQLSKEVSVERKHRGLSQPQSATARTACADGSAHQHVGAAHGGNAGNVQNAVLASPASSVRIAAQAALQIQRRAAAAKAELQRNESAHPHEVEHEPAAHVRSSSVALAHMHSSTNSVQHDYERQGADVASDPVDPITATGVAMATRSSRRPGSRASQPWQGEPVVRTTAMVARLRTLAQHACGSPQRVDAPGTSLSGARTKAAVEFATAPTPVFPSSDNPHGDTRQPSAPFHLVQPLVDLQHAAECKLQLACSMSPLLNDKPIEQLQSVSPPQPETLLSSEAPNAMLHRTVAAHWSNARSCAIKEEPSLASDHDGAHDESFTAAQMNDATQVQGADVCLAMAAVNASLTAFAHHPLVQSARVASHYSDGYAADWARSTSAPPLERCQHAQRRHVSCFDRWPEGLSERQLPLSLQASEACVSLRSAGITIEAESQRQLAIGVAAASCAHAYDELNNAEEQQQHHGARYAEPSKDQSAEQVTSNEDADLQGIASELGHGQVPSGTVNSQCEHEHSVSHQALEHPTGKGVAAAIIADMSRDPRKRRICTRGTQSERIKTVPDGADVRQSSFEVDLHAEGATHKWVQQAEERAPSPDAAHAQPSKQARAAPTDNGDTAPPNHHQMPAADHAFAAKPASDTAYTPLFETEQHARQVTPEAAMSPHDSSEDAQPSLAPKRNTKRQRKRQREQAQQARVQMLKLLELTPNFTNVARASDDDSDSDSDMSNADSNSDASAETDLAKLKLTWRREQVERALALHFAEDRAYSLEQRARLLTIWQLPDASPMFTSILPFAVKNDLFAWLWAEQSHRPVVASMLRDRASVNDADYADFKLLVDYALHGELPFRVRIAALVDALPLRTGMLTMLISAVKESYIDDFRDPGEEVQPQKLPRVLAPTFEGTPSPEQIDVLFEALGTSLHMSARARLVHINFSGDDVDLPFRNLLLDAVYTHPNEHESEAERCKARTLSSVVARHKVFIEGGDVLLRPGAQAPLSDDGMRIMWPLSRASLTAAQTQQLIDAVTPKHATKARAAAIKRTHPERTAFSKLLMAGVYASPAPHEQNKRTAVITTQEALMVRAARFLLMQRNQARVAAGADSSRMSSPQGARAVPDHAAPVTRNGAHRCRPESAPLDAAPVPSELQIGSYAGRDAEQLLAAATASVPATDRERQIWNSSKDGSAMRKLLMSAMRYALRVGGSNDGALAGLSKKDAQAVQTAAVLAARRGARTPQIQLPENLRQQDAPELDPRRSRLHGGGPAAAATHKASTGTNAAHAHTLANTQSGSAVSAQPAATRPLKRGGNWQAQRSSAPLKRQAPAVQQPHPALAKPQPAPQREQLAERPASSAHAQTQTQVADGNGAAVATQLAATGASPFEQTRTAPPFATGTGGAPAVAAPVTAPTVQPDVPQAMQPPALESAATAPPVASTMPPVHAPVHSTDAEPPRPLSPSTPRRSSVPDSGNDAAAAAAALDDATSPPRRDKSHGGALMLSGINLNSILPGGSGKKTRSQHTLSTSMPPAPDAAVSLSPAAAPIAVPSRPSDSGAHSHAAGSAISALAKQRSSRDIDSRRSSMSAEITAPAAPPVPANKQNRWRPYRCAINGSLTDAPSSHRSRRQLQLHSAAWQSILHINIGTVQCQHFLQLCANQPWLADYTTGASLGLVSCPMLNQV